MVKKTIKIEVPSKKGKLNKVDMLSMGKSLFLASTGALVDIMSEYAFNIDYGEMTPLIYAGIPVMVNLIHKWIRGKSN